MNCCSRKAISLVTLAFIVHIPFLFILPKRVSSRIPNVGRYITTKEVEFPGDSSKVRYLLR
jgi:hypothetical protein